MVHVQFISSHCRCAYCSMQQLNQLMVHKRKYDHITTDIRDQLHWLAIQQGLEYNDRLLIYKCLQQMAQVYLVARDE